VKLSDMPPGLGIGSCRQLLLIWVLGVVSHSFWWLDSTLLSQTLVVFRFLRVSSITSYQSFFLVAG